jgi:predicted Fe-Mo cluster-binding NifX family protein
MEHPMMKIAVASQNRREITGHTGRCRRFWIYDIDGNGAIASKRLLEIGKAETFHASSPHEPHPLDQVQVLISGGMGNGMRRRLVNRGIEAEITNSTDPDAAVNAWLNGRPEPAPMQAALTRYRHPS